MLLHSHSPERIQIKAPVFELRVSASAVPEGANLQLDVTLEPTVGGIVAHGKLVAPWSGECRRCLEAASGLVQAEFRELFEHDPSDEMTFPIKHEQIDLEPLVREAVLVELPQAPLCRTDCAGLCPDCGANRKDVASCDCTVDLADPRWADLDQLKSDS